MITELERTLPRIDTRLSDLSVSQRVSLGCIQKRRVLRGAVDAYDDFGMTINCGTRSLADCPYCAGLYKGDCSKLMRLGIFSSDLPFLWVTMSLPSFGPVHRIPKRTVSEALRPNLTRGNRRAGRCSCGVLHRFEDSALYGVPVCPETYDYQGAVLANASAGALLTETWRLLAHRLRPRDSGPFQRVKVIEYQARGAVHVHALIRWDLEEEPDVDEVKRVILDATYTDPESGRVYRWGSPQGQDVRVVDTTHEAGRREAALKTGYLSKLLNYSAKSLNEGPDGEEVSRERGEHFRRLRVVANEVGVTRRIQVAQFGYNGHAFGVSRNWTPNGENLTSLRQARVDYRVARAEARRVESGVVAEPLVEDPVYTIVPLARPKTIKDVLAWSQNNGWSDQDYNVHADFGPSLRPAERIVAVLDSPPRPRRSRRSPSSPVRPVADFPVCISCYEDLALVLAPIGLHIGCEVTVRGIDDLEEYD